MRFARQKLLIALCFVATLPVGVLALLETPELSTLVLKVSLKFARLRTGLKIDASAWSVSPLTFSAKLDDVKLVQKPVSLQAPRVEVWVSPVALLVGRLHFSQVEIAGAKLVIDAPDFLTKNPFDKKDDTPSKFLENGDFGDDYPKLFGTAAREALRGLRERNIDFDDLRLTGFDLAIGALRVRQLDFLLNNLQEGQLRTEWKLESASVENGLAGAQNFHGALSLLRTRENAYQLYIGEAGVSLPDSSGETLRLRGAWPGEIVVDAKTEVTQVEAWVKASPWLKKQRLGGRNAGSLTVNATAQIAGTRLVDVKTSLASKGLVVEDFAFNQIDAKADFGFRDSKFRWSLAKFQVVLSQPKGVRPGWKNRLSLQDLDWGEEGLKATLQLDEASLCGIMIAASEKECQVGVAFSGPLHIEGQLKPLRLKATPDFEVTAGPVMSDPYFVPKSEPIVQLKPGHLTGTAQIRDKDLVFEKMRMLWQDKDEIGAEGNLEYSPTKLHLKVTAKEARLDQVLSELVGLKFGGPSTLEGEVFYDHSLEKQKRTRISGKIRSSAFQFEDQDFGSISGPIRYEERILFLGPYQLRSGGGTALVQGSVSPNEERGSFLNLVVQANRFEFAAFTDAKRKTEAFRGFLSGRGTLNGFVDAERDPNNGLRGDLNFRARNFKAFGIPFSEAELQGFYEKKDLRVERIVARKDGARLSLKGLLSPKGGSELTFESEPIPLRNIEIEPKLGIFEKGLVEIQGFWRPDRGWGVKGQIQGATVAGQSLGSGTVDVGATKDENLHIDLKFGKLLDVHYEGVTRKEQLFIERLETKMKDAGIYAGLAYLGDWRQAMPVEARGSLAFEWKPHEGYFETEDLRLAAPQASESARDTVLDVPGAQKISWNPSGVTGNSMAWTGPASLRARAVPGASRIGVEADLPLGLVKLFLPAIDIRAGRAKFSGSIPLSPHFQTLSLQGHVNDGILKVPGVAGSLDGLNFDLDMQRSLVTLKQGSVRAGSGTVRFGGAYRVDFEKPATDLTLELDGAQLVLMDDVPATLNGEVQVRGEKIPYLMSGHVVVTDALYGKEFGAESEERLDAVPVPAIGFDLDVDLNTGTRVRNSVVASEVRGRLKMGGDNIVPQLRGEMSLLSGTIFANQSEFTILQSRIQFVGGKQKLPIVNIRATTTTRYENVDYKIEMNAHGPADSLNIEFTSDPVLSTQDIVSLLAFGVKRTEENGGSSDELANAAQAEAFQAVFGRAIGNSLSKSTGFDVRLKASTTQIGASTKTDSIPKVSVARRLSERVTARFARSLDINNPEKDVQVDYRLLRNLNLSGVWERKNNTVSGVTDNATQDEYSLGVDMRFKFDID